MGGSSAPLQLPGRRSRKSSGAAGIPAASATEQLWIPDQAIFPYSVRLRTVVAPCCYSSLNELSLLFSPPALHILLTAPLFKIPVVVSSDWTVTSTYTYKLNTKIEGKLGAWVAQRVKRLPLAQS